MEVRSRIQDSGGKRKTLSGAGEDCFRGLFYEVSLALVGVASPAYFQ
jgi:hypothetical protein